MGPLGDFPSWDKNDDFNITIEEVRISLFCSKIKKKNRIFNIFYRQKNSNVFLKISPKRLIIPVFLGFYKKHNAPLSQLS